MVRVTLPNGSTETFDGAAVAVADVAATLDERARGGMVGVLFGGKLHDVYQSISGEGTLRPLRDSDEQSLYLLRHTAAHLLAHAVQELFPDAKFAIGPPIDNGFYYDFDVEKPFTPEDLERIEQRLQELLKEKVAISREDWDKPRARA
jgi:threonyl-tRNA synthetase